MNLYAEKEYRSLKSIDYDKIIKEGTNESTQKTAAHKPYQLDFGEKKIKKYDSVAEYYADKYGIGSDGNGKCERTK